MWRALLFIGLLCVAAFGAVWLADRPGTVLITFGGYEVQMSVAVAAVALAGLSGGLAGHGGRGRRRYHRGPPLCQRGRAAPRPRASDPSPQGPGCPGLRQPGGGGGR